MLLILLMDFAILVELASEEADDTKEKALKTLNLRTRDLGNCCANERLKRNGKLNFPMKMIFLRI